MNKEFPCKVCTHPAEYHYINVIGDKFICIRCAEGGPRNYISINEHLHEFVGDNFKYLKLLDKREEIKNENRR